MGVTDVGIAEARRDLSAIINRVVYGGERIILASRGKPKAAIISIKDLRRLEEMEKTVDESARTEGKAALAMAKAVREMSLHRRRGVPLPDVSQDLYELREENIRQAKTFLVPRRDLSAWQEERDFINQLIQQGPLPGGRSWRREDLYER